MIHKICTSYQKSNYIDYKTKSILSLPTSNQVFNSIINPTFRYTNLNQQIQTINIKKQTQKMGQEPQNYKFE
jgi:hypothetical protein